MNRIEAYIRNVMDAVPRCLPQRDEIEKEVRAHIVAAVEAGESEREAIREMGPASELARAYLSDLPVRYASLWRRAVAFLADMALIFAALVFAVGVWVVVFSVPELFASQGGGPGSAAPVGLAAVVSWTVIGVGYYVAGTFIYFPLFEAGYGQTPGKYWLGIGVVGTSRGRLDYRRAMIRRLPLLLNIFVVDAVVAFFTEKRQRAFDFLADAVVVSVRSAP